MKRDKALKALKESIAHWRRLATGKSKRGEGVYSDDCALCKAFRGDGLFGDCRSCPVSDKTGSTLCYGTPYREALAAYRDQGKHSKAFKAAAKKELTFLESLLPEAKRK